MRLKFWPLLSLSKEKEYHRTRIQLCVFFTLWFAGLCVATGLILFSMSHTPQWYRETLNSSEQSFLQSIKHFGEVCQAPFIPLSEAVARGAGAGNYTIEWNLTDEYLTGTFFDEFFTKKDLHVHSTPREVRFQKETITFHSVSSDNHYAVKTMSITTDIEIESRTILQSAESSHYLTGRVSHPLPPPMGFWTVEWENIPLDVKSYRFPVVCSITTSNNKGEVCDDHDLVCPQGSTFQKRNGGKMIEPCLPGAICGDCVGPAMLSEIRVAVDLCVGNVWVPVDKNEARHPGHAHAWSKTSDPVPNHIHTMLPHSVQPVYRSIENPYVIQIAKSDTLSIRVSLWDIHDPRTLITEFAHVPSYMIPLGTKSGTMMNIPIHFGSSDSSALESHSSQQWHKKRLGKWANILFIAGLLVTTSGFLLAL